MVLAVAPAVETPLRVQHRGSSRSHASVAICYCGVCAYTTLEQSRDIYRFDVS